MSTTREKVRRMKCPECGARTRRPCVGPDGRERTANHQARLEKYATYKLHKQPDFNRAQALGVALDPEPMTREEFRARVRSVSCPRCGAVAKQWCASRRPAGRKAVHPERSAAYALAS